MATILRGKDKGKQVEIRQWCNDWVTVKGTSKTVLAITALEFTDAEMFDILTHKNNGTLLGEFEQLPYKNRFRRRKKGYFAENL